MRGAAGLTHRRDLVVKRLPAAGQHMFAGNDDVDFIGALIDGIADFLKPQVQRHQTGGKAGGDAGDRDAGALKRAHGMGDHGRIDADRAGGQAHVADAKARDDMGRQRLACLGAKPAHAFGGVVARKRRQVDAAHGIQQPCRLPVLLDAAPLRQRDRAPLGRAAIDGVALKHGDVQRHAGIARVVGPRMRRGLSGHVHAPMRKLRAPATGARLALRSMSLPMRGHPPLPLAKLCRIGAGTSTVVPRRRSHRPAPTSRYSRHRPARSSRSSGWPRPRPGTG